MLCGPRRQGAPPPGVSLQHRPDVHHDLHELQVQLGTLGRERDHGLRTGERTM